MAEQSKLPIKILIAGKQARSLTRVTSIGPYVLVIDTVLPEPAHALELHSIYVGHMHTKTQATHLRLARGGIRETTTAEHEHTSLPVVHARRRCLYDHLHHLQDLLEEVGIEAKIPIDEDAIVAVED